VARFAREAGIVLLLFGVERRFSSNTTGLLASVIRFLAPMQSGVRTTGFPSSSWSRAATAAAHLGIRLPLGGQVAGQDECAPLRQGVLDGGQ